MVINKGNYIGACDMTNEKVKRMLDACYQAKRIRELLPTGSYAVLYSVYGYDPETGKAGNSGKDFGYQ